MTTVRVAAAQASYELMDRDATIDRVAGLTAEAAARGAQLVVFPEAFVPGTARMRSDSWPRSAAPAQVCHVASCPACRCFSTATTCPARPTDVAAALTQAAVGC